MKVNTGVRAFLEVIAARHPSLNSRLKAQGAVVGKDGSHSTSGGSDGNSQNNTRTVSSQALVKSLTRPAEESQTVSSRPGPFKRIRGPVFQGTLAQRNGKPIFESTLTNRVRPPIFNPNAAKNDGWPVIEA